MTDASRPLRVTVVYALPETQHSVELKLEAGSTVVDALAAVETADGFSDLDLGSALAAGRVGVYGERAAGDRRLEDGDRVEIYRPLAVDPREARRRRAGD